MNRTIDFTQAGGLYCYQDTLDFLQTAYSQSLDAIAKVIGDKIILTGVVDQGSQASAGWIVYGGEVLPFVGGLKAQYVVIEEIVTNEQFDDAVQRPVYTIRRAKFGNAIGAGGGFPYAELSRLPFNAAGINSALNSIQNTLKNIINFEPEVIIDGCIVSAVTVNTMQISGGIVMFSGNLVATPSYSGTFPAYISDKGIWSSVQPGTGQYVKFDPHTSQRYKDVVRRFNYQTGDLLFSKVLSDRFDATTGIGKWEWQGFRLSMDMRGRVPLGFWFGDNSPVEYDPVYTGIGNPLGEKKYQLTKSELPAYNMETEVIGDNGYPRLSGDRGGPDQYLLSPLAANINPRRLKVSSGGGDQAHENRQPSRVVAIIERM